MPPSRELWIVSPRRCDPAWRSSLADRALERVQAVGKVIDLAGYNDTDIRLARVNGGEDLILDETDPR